MSIEPDDAGDDPRQDAPRWTARQSAAMAVALALLAASAWIYLGVRDRAAPLLVGSRFPPTRLERLADADPLLVLGQEGRVTWLVFLPIDAREGLEPLAQLESHWRKFRANSRFSLVAAAVDNHQPSRAPALGEYRGRLPLYVADGEVQHLFGVDRVDSLRHILIGPRGRIDLIADGSDGETIDRVAHRARLWLDALAPPRDARFFLARAD